METYLKFIAQYIMSSLPSLAISCQLLAVWLIAKNLLQKPKMDSSTISVINKIGVFLDEPCIQNYI